MAFVVTSRPTSQIPAGPSGSAPVPGFVYFPQKRPAAKSHYRPYSTLFVKEREEASLVRQAATTTVTPHRNSVLQKSRRQSLHHSVSLGSAMGLGKKKAMEKESASKEKPPAPQIRKPLSDIPSPIPPTEFTTTKSLMSRPSTSAGTVGLTLAAERSQQMNGKGSALHRVKAQRSIGSLFTAAATDVSPHHHTGILEQSAAARSSSSRPITPPPIPNNSNNTMHNNNNSNTTTTSVRPRKMDRTSSKRPRTTSQSRPRRPSRAVDRDSDDTSMKRAASNLDSDVWLTRSRTRLHPFKDVPYMQSYDITSFENDRSTELLLERMNPGSPSFHDYGRKYPLTALDLGCGQGDWCIYAASIWKHSRVFGFDLMDVTLPTFQTADNLKFVQGNFLTTLPFPDKTFDFVRMANLSLCIPYDRWLPLLNEVRRVLTNNGRLELIDDQMMFPYGEEPHTRESPIPDVHPVPPKAPSMVSKDSSKKAASQVSFVNFDSDSDMDDVDSMVTDDDTYETASTSSTLVSDRDSGYYDKLPSSKRSSSQSNASTSVESEGAASSEGAVRRPTSISFAPDVKVQHDSLVQPTISPSPTVTQATFQTLDFDQRASHTSTIMDSKRHKKNDSVSSTRSNSEVIGAWRGKKVASVELETIFEHILVERFGIHPRPSEFICDTLSRIFGNKNAGKVKSFHIKLAPYDSPIGPGGALSFEVTESAPGLRVEKADKKAKRDMWDASSKKDKKRDRKKLENAAPLEEVLYPPLTHPSMLNLKAASRLGITGAIPPPPPRRHTESSGESMTRTPSSRSKRSSVNLPPTAGTVAPKAAGRLGIPVVAPPVPPKSESVVNSYVGSSSKHASDPRPLDSTVRLVVPRQTPSAPNLSSDDSSSISLSITPTNSFGASSSQMDRTISGSSATTSTSSDGSTISMAEALRSGFIPESSSTAVVRSGSSTPSSSSSSSSSSQGSSISLGEALRGDFTPPQPSAKAAGRLGIKYSVLALASASHGRNAGIMAPVQSPGILVWPSTYIAIPPAELEMHSCKWVQTLLSCRHALREYITGPFEGTKLVDDEEFDQAIWDYECFRRSRFHWPNDNPELFEEDTSFPEPFSPTSPNPSREQAQDYLQSEQERQAALAMGVPAHSGRSSTESFNGQYRRDELTHVRTIRVFHAVKNVEDKSFVQMLFPGR